MRRPQLVQWREFSRTVEAAAKATSDIDLARRRQALAVHAHYAAQRLDRSEQSPVAATWSVLTKGEKLPPAKEIATSLLAEIRTIPPMMLTELGVTISSTDSTLKEELKDALKKEEKPESKQARFERGALICRPETTL
jgi:hypothetical protein